MKHHRLKPIALIMALALLFAALPALSLADGPAVWDGGVAESYSGGSGTENDPYLISNGSELALLASRVNSGESTDGLYFLQTADICLNDTANYESWSAENAPSNVWTPIGIPLYSENWEEDPVLDISLSFLGNYDGGSHTVYGLYVNKSGDDSIGAGLFGCAVAGHIENLNVECSLVIGVDSVGAIVGHNAAWISNCRNGGEVSGSWDVGGIVGSGQMGSIEFCTNSGRITGIGNTGGIAGRLCSCSVSQSMNSGRIEGGFQTGGIIGSLEDASASYCGNAGSVSGSQLVGGTAGNAFVSDIFACYNAGDITGIVEGEGDEQSGFAVGGIVGWFEGHSESSYTNDVSNCYCSGNVYGSRDVGGIIGYGDVLFFIEYCYTAGNISAELNADAIIGYSAIATDDVIDRCLHLIIEGSAYSPYARPVTADELSQQSTYENYDFELIWTMDGSPDYPFAELQVIPHLEDISISEIIPGDANGNGSVTIADAILTMRRALDIIGDSAVIFENADMDGDGSITAADAIMVARAALGL